MPLASREAASSSPPTADDITSGFRLRTPPEAGEAGSSGLARRPSGGLGTFSLLISHHGNKTVVRAARPKRPPWRPFGPSHRYLPDGGLPAYGAVRSVGRSGCTSSRRNMGRCGGLHPRQAATPNGKGSASALQNVLQGTGTGHPARVGHRMQSAPQRERCAVRTGGINEIRAR